MDGNVRRHKWIKVEAQNLMGKPIKKKYEGWEARVFQHEYDHLEGKVYIDRLEEEEDKERVKPVLEGLIQKYKDEYGDDYAL
jgi:peptide deformylase